NARERNLTTVLKLIELCEIDENDSGETSPLDILMMDLEEESPDSYAVKTYKKFRCAAGKTLKSILISVNALIGVFDTPELESMLMIDTISIPSIGQKPTALFVVVSDTDRSMDVLANLFFTQAMNELCYYADNHTKNNRLPVPVRFILDDFATNCQIAEFPRMISSIRSRDISAMLMIQAESQLEKGYGPDEKTIIGNCDTYIYLGGNDVDTAKAVAVRCDVPVKKILNMPVGTNWIFRRGQAPVNGVNFELEPFLESKGINKNTQNQEMIR
ncbi:MAG: type IV secretory system conjugative DNA transfer family protein, partial [Lachnospiraceae bacterium]|nr:type IV secretory system conjugative DNA transfer family protein [Lachnospiraceae bacterium]